MPRMLKTVLAIVFAARMFALGVGVAAAQPVSSPHSHVGVAVKVTTLGVAIEGATPVHDRLNVRAGLDFFSPRAPRATLSLAGSACSLNGKNCSSIATDPTLQSELVTEQNKMNDDLSPLKAWPVVSIGFGYKF